MNLTASPTLARLMDFSIRGLDGLAETWWVKVNMDPDLVLTVRLDLSFGAGTGRPIGFFGTLDSLLEVDFSPLLVLGVCLVQLAQSRTSRAPTSLLTWRLPNLTAELVQLVLGAATATVG